MDNIRAIGFAGIGNVQTAFKIGAARKYAVIAVPVAHQLELLCVAAVKIMLLNICAVVRTAVVNIKIFSAVFILYVVSAIQTEYTAVIVCV